MKENKETITTSSGHLLANTPTEWYQNAHMARNLELKGRDTNGESEESKAVEKLEMCNRPRSEQDGRREKRKQTLDEKQHLKCTQSYPSLLFFFCVLVGQT